MYRKSLFIFRRDLRIHDNTALINAINLSESVNCLYILDENIITSKSEYSSLDFSIKPADLYRRKQRRDHLLAFLKISLIDLQKQFSNLDSSDNVVKNKSKYEHGVHSASKRNRQTDNSKLSFLFGDPPSLIDMILQRDNEIEAVFLNKDYTPYSKRRDRLIERSCQKNGVNFFPSADLLLNEPGEILNSAKKPFKVFTQYYKESLKRTVREESSISLNKLKKISDGISTTNLLQGKLKDHCLTDLDTFFDGIFHNKKNKTLQGIQGGKNGYLIEVADLAERLARYDEEKDLPEKGATSHLSPFIKFGICSIREVYHTLNSLLRDSNQILSIQRQLYWRDFFTYIGFHFPYVFGHSFKDRYSETSSSTPIQWKNSLLEFEKWCTGKTGFPIVDAGMRELNETGYMHNRARLITASFLVKDLHIDWRYGERYFALKLIDYDPCVNNGNWQWVASTGCDSMPYFRIFNPWLQLKKFDPDCGYVKRWIPEIGAFSIKVIHEWYKQFKGGNSIDKTLTDNINRIGDKETLSYPRPIVDHYEEMRRAKLLYGN